MAYMRGNCYVWRDDRSIHFWAMDGHDSWDESGWAQEVNNGSVPSGVSLPQEVADEYVVMRVAELVRDGLFAGAVDRALANHAGNFGCAALRVLAVPIVTALETVTPGGGEANGR